MIAELIGRLWLMGIQSSVLILVILTVRPFLKRYPKLYSYSLWILVGISLLCPIRLTSPYSLQPDFSDNMIFSSKTANEASSQQPENSSATKSLTLVSRLLLENAAFSDLSQKTGGFGAKFTDTKMKESDIFGANSPETGFLDIFNGRDKQSSLKSSNTAGKNASLNHIFQLLGIFYLAGAGVVSLCFLAQYLRVHRKILPAIRENGNIWLCEAISSPFVIGICKPRILLPFTLTEPEKSHILLHERTHIRHHDPLARLIGLICICLHWWNPLVWLAAYCMEQDMEMFCDESALQDADLKKRKEYAKTLLSYARWQSGLTSGLAFGESNTERRVENIMKKRKNNQLVMCCFILIAVFCAVAFLTIPKVAKSEPERSEAPVYFGDFALLDNTVYLESVENESPKILPLPIESNYFAIYNNELYYAIEDVGTETGEISDGHLTFYCCGLDGTNQRKLIELPEIYAVANTVLQDGFLYCSYIKDANEPTTIARIHTSGEAQTEYQLPVSSGRCHFSKDCIYYVQYANSNLWIFYAYYLESEEVKELYRYHGYYVEDFSIWDSKLLLLLEMDGKLKLFSVDENQTITDYGNYEADFGRLLTGKEAYCSIDRTLYRLDEKEENWIPLKNLIPEGIEAIDIFPFEEKGNSLYYLIGGSVSDDEWKNTFLMRYDSTNEECELLHAYYRP